MTGTYDHSQIRSVPDASPPNKSDLPVNEESPPEPGERFLTREAILNAPDQPVTVDLPEVGSVTLRAVRLHDLDWLRDVTSTVDGPRALALAVLHRQWMDDGEDSSRLDTLPDEHLARLVREWLNDAIALEVDELADLQSIHAAVRAALHRWDAPVRRMAENSISRVFVKLRDDDRAVRRAFAQLDPFARMRTISEITPHYQAVRRLAGIEGIADSAGALAKGAQQATDEIRRATEGPSRAFVDLLAREERQRAAFLRGVLPSLELTDNIARAYTAAVGLQGRSISQALESITALQETAARTLTLQGMVEQSVVRMTLSQPQISALNGLGSLTRSTTAFWSNLAEEPSSFATMPDHERGGSVERVFRATRSTGLLLAPEPEILEAEPAISMLAVEAAEIVPRLEQVDPALVPIYLGALERFRLKGNEYIRHTSNSMRALFENMLPILAPKDAIKAWDSSVLPKKGPISYKARLAFIFRHTAQWPGYELMTVNDILHIEQSLIVLDEQVHRKEPSISDATLGELLIRWEYSLQHVLRTHERSLRDE